MPSTSTSCWLLLRGLGRERRHWGRFPTGLESALHTRVLTLDLPGFGTECGQRSPVSVPAITDDVRRRFSMERAEARWCIIGISLGGMVALDWCSRYPRDFERCVIIN